MGVVPQEHRHGIGRLLLGEAESRLVTAGVEFLQVKTLNFLVQTPSGFTPEIGMM
jgi:GNAT superfamily N-acetyltransferase